MSLWVLGGGDVDKIGSQATEDPRDLIHENGSDLNLNEDPEEDWGETVPPEQSE